MVLKREIFAKLVKNLDQEKITILLGARQVGKTTLLKEIEKKAKKQGYKTKFFNLENPDQIAEFNKSEREIFQFLTKEKNTILFFDEFQYIKNISKVFKAIYDEGLNIKIFASGSSSLEIHKHLKESLAGRKLSYIIYPLSFNEIKTKVGFDEYVQYGGLPGLLHETTNEDKLKLLNNILETYVLKDVKSLIKEENISAFNNLLKLLASYQKQIVDMSSLSREISLTVPSVAKYLDILNQTYIIYPLNSFSKNLSNELKKSKKYFFYDNGIRNLLVKDFSALKSRKDKSSLYEAYVFNYLNSQILPNMELRFWRTKDKKPKEIDFILLKNQTPYPIELKSKIKAGEIPQHLISFFKAYPETEEAFVINENHDMIIDFEGKSIHFISYEKLEENEYLKEILLTV